MRSAGLAAALGFCLTGAAEAADRWEVRADESRLGFVATQQKFPFDGEFKEFEAEILFSPDDLAGSKVVVSVDIASFDSGSRDRDGQVGDRDWFSVKSFPTARYETTGFEALDDGSYKALGELTIRDKTQAVDLPFTLEIDGTVARMSGETRLDRRDFNVGTGQWRDDNFVGFPVTVKITLVADKAS
jgi:polyisoprenoid-binding protein YceI